jgi:hypothetical protein
MTGTGRNNRGVNTICYRHGATPLEKDLILHGVQVDLLAFYRESVHLSPDPAISSLVQELWANRLAFQDKPKLKSVA